MLRIDQVSIPSTPQSQPLRDFLGKAPDTIRQSAPKILGLPVPFGIGLRNGIAVLLFLGIVAWCRDSLMALYMLSRAQDHYSHIVLIPWISLYALYLKRIPILESREWNPLVGGLLLGIGFGLDWFGGGTGNDSRLSTSMLAMIIMVWGSALTLFGVRACRTGSFGLLFLLFMVPFPTWALDGIIGFLQRSSTEVVDMIFTLIGVPVFRQEFVFSLSNFTIHVAEECSGIRSTLSLIVTSLVAGHFLLRSWWGKASILLLVVPLAIVKNAFRIVALALLANYVDPSFITDGALHQFGGIPLFGLSVGVLLLLTWMLRRLENLDGSFLHGRVHAKL